MILLPNSRFLCVPKTASLWTSNAILKSVEGSRGTGLSNTNYHAHRANAPGCHLPTFATVRHPAGWYGSYWNHRKRSGPRAKTVIDTIQAESKTFEEFVMGCSSKSSGWLSRAVENWVGPPEDEIDFVGRFENVMSDIVFALVKFGESFELPKIEEEPRKNVSNYEVFPAAWTDEMRQAICDSERKIIERFYS